MRFKMKNKEFSNIRYHLEKSQKQLAKLLCVSTKAVQSYEQGWRQIPPHQEQQMLLLLSLKSFSNWNIQPCWEIKDCPSKWRDTCIVWELQARHFCWLINGTSCQGKVHKNWNEKVKICRECKIFKSVLPNI